MLTATHVVEADAAPLVRFDADQPGERSVVAKLTMDQCRVRSCVLTIPALDDAPAVDAARFGRLVDRDAVLGARAMGFPLFKLRAP